MGVVKVGVFGAAGRMGAEVCRAVSADPELELVAAVDPMIKDAGVPSGTTPDVMADQGVRYMDQAVGGLTPQQRAAVDANMARYRKYLEARDRQGRFFDLRQQSIAEALAAPDLHEAVQRVVRLHLEHVGDRLADDVLLVLGQPGVTHFHQPNGVALAGGHEST